MSVISLSPKKPRVSCAGEYGATPAPMNAELQSRVLDEGEIAITCRPADNIEPELEALTTELEGLSAEHGFALSAGEGRLMMYLPTHYSRKWLEIFTE